MRPAIALARAELTILARNRVAAATGVLLPVALAAWLLVNPPPEAVPGSLVGGSTALMLLMLTAMTVASTATTTLVARRQQHLLERWRLSGASTAAVLVGTLTPVMLVFAAATAVLFIASGIAFEAVPAEPGLLALAAVLAAALGCGAAFVTAAFTRTVEAAQISLLPAMAALIAGGMWAYTIPAGQVTWPMRVTGGGSLVDLVRIGWQGAAEGGGGVAAWTAAGPSVVVLTVLTGVLALLATRTFRWQACG